MLESVNFACDEMPLAFMIELTSLRSHRSQEYLHVGSSEVERKLFLGYCRQNLVLFFSNLLFLLFSRRKQFSLICRKNEEILNEHEIRLKNMGTCTKGVIIVKASSWVSSGNSLYIFYLHPVLHCTTKGNFGYISLNVYYLEHS